MDGKVEVGVNGELFWRSHDHSLAVLDNGLVLKAVVRENGEVCSAACVLSKHCTDCNLPHDYDMKREDGVVVVSLDGRTTLRRFAQPYEVICTVYNSDGSVLRMYNVGNEINKAAAELKTEAQKAQASVVASATAEAQKEQPPTVQELPTESDDVPAIVPSLLPIADFGDHVYNLEHILMMSADGSLIVADDGSVYKLSGFALSSQCENCEVKKLCKDFCGRTKCFGRSRWIYHGKLTTPFNVNSNDGNVVVGDRTVSVTLPGYACPVCVITAR